MASSREICECPTFSEVIVQNYPGQKYGTMLGKRAGDDDDDDDGYRARHVRIMSRCRGVARRRCNIVTEAKKIIGNLLVPFLLALILIVRSTKASRSTPNRSWRSATGRRAAVRKSAFGSRECARGPCSQPVPAN